MQSLGQRSSDCIHARTAVNQPLAFTASYALFDSVTELHVVAGAAELVPLLERLVRRVAVPHRLTSGRGTRSQSRHAQRA
jgi:hypothetical protein